MSAEATPGGGHRPRSQVQLDQRDRTIIPSSLSAAVNGSMATREVIRGLCKSLENHVVGSSKTIRE